METNDIPDKPNRVLVPEDEKERELLLADWRDAVRICRLPPNYPFEGISDS